VLPGQAFGFASATRDRIDYELAKQDADDVTAARDGLEEIRSGDSILWEELKTRLGL